MYMWSVPVATRNPNVHLTGKHFSHVASRPGQNRWYKYTGMSVWQLFRCHIIMSQSLVCQDMPILCACTHIPIQINMIGTSHHYTGYIRHMYTSAARMLRETFASYLDTKVICNVGYNWSGRFLSTTPSDLKFLYCVSQSDLGCWEILGGSNIVVCILYILIFICVTFCGSIYNICAKC